MEPWEASTFKVKEAEPGKHTEKWGSERQEERTLCVCGGV